MSVEALLSIVLSLAFTFLGLFLIFTYEKLGVFKSLFLCFFSIVLVLMLFMGLGVQQEGEIREFNSTTNVTVVKPLYSENPYVNFLYVPLILLISVFIFLTARLFIGLGWVVVE